MISKEEKSNRPKAKKLSRLRPEFTRKQEVEVESAAEGFSKPAVQTASVPAPQVVEKPVQKLTKRTFRWGIEEDKELVDAIDEFNRTLPAGTKRLKMEHLGRAMRKHFISADVQQILKDAHKETYNNN